MKKTILIIILIIIAGLLVWWYFGSQNAPVVTNFEECIAAGNPVMESYPRRCKHGDQTFIEVIIRTFTQNDGPINWSVDIPSDWFAYENGPTVIFTQDPYLEIPTSTELFAIGPSFYITLHNITDIEGITSYEEWLDINGMTEKSPLFIESKNVEIGEYSMKRITTEAAGSEGEVLHYVYFADVQRIVTLSQYPYDPKSNITQVLETAVQTFHVPERQGNGGGILPFKSGVSGIVTLGPTCPVIREDDESCADKPYKTTVLVIANGPKSSPFAVVESDDEGHYKVILPPGDYGIQPVGGNPFPRCETKNITIEPDAMQEVNLSCDTGIR